jgi:hypothetical protein
MTPPPPAGRAMGPCLGSAVELALCIRPTPLRRGILRWQRVVEAVVGGVRLAPVGLPACTQADAPTACRLTAPIPGTSSARPSPLGIGAGGTLWLPAGKRRMTTRCGAQSLPVVLYHWNFLAPVQLSFSYFFNYTNGWLLLLASSFLLQRCSTSLTPVFRLERSSGSTTDRFGLSSGSYHRLPLVSS